MSDVFPGPGAWLASDGKWYDASSHPDETYRQSFAEAGGEQSPAPDEQSPAPDEQSPAPDEQSPVGDEDGVGELSDPDVVEDATDAATVSQPKGSADADADLQADAGADADTDVDEDTDGDVEAVPEVLEQRPIASDSESGSETQLSEEHSSEGRLEDDPQGATVGRQGQEFPSVEIVPPVEDDGVEQSAASRLNTIIASASKMREHVDGGIGGVAAGAALATGALIPSTRGSQSVPDESAMSVAIEELDDREELGERDEHEGPDADRGERDDANADVGDVDEPPEPRFEEPVVEPLGAVNATDLDDVADEEIPEVSLDEEIPEVQAPEMSREEHAPISSVTVMPDEDVLDAEAPDIAESGLAAAGAVALSGGAKKPPRSQTEALEEARRARLAEAKARVETLRDAGRADRDASTNQVDIDSAASKDASSRGYFSAAVLPTISVPGSPKKQKAANKPTEKNDRTEKVDPTNAVEGRTKLELAGAERPEPPASKFGLVPPTSTDMTTDLVHVPVEYEPPVPFIDRALAFLVFLGGLAMLVGTFMPWSTGPDGELGWDRVDGIVVVVAGVFAAVSAGPLWAGFRHRAGRGVAMLAGSVGLVIIGIVVIQTLSNGEETGLSIGSGAFAVLAGSVAALIAGAASTPEDPY